MATDVPEIIEFNPFELPSGPLSQFERADAMRERYGSFRSTFGPGFWVFTSDATVRHILRTPEVFSSRSVLVTEPDPAPYPLIPEYSDPPEHTKWRRLLAPLFAPKTVATMTAGIRERCRALLVPLAEKGRCDFVADVAQRFPVEVFMDLLGLPIEEVDQFMAWEHDMLHLRDGSEEELHRQIAARAAVEEYFSGLIVERRRDPQDDMVSAALTWTLDGDAIPEGDLLTLLSMLFMAGLDTVSSALSFGFFSLATHPADRRRLASDPSVVHYAVEEHLRCFTGPTFGREATRDVVVDGCPVKAGERLWVTACAANRDPAKRQQADEVVIDRQNNDHIAFGYGPHRCIGMHLARRELNVVYSEWHTLIPEYELTPGAVVRAHAGVVGLDELPLVWR